MRWNPFGHLIESKEYPFSRIIHASFFKRMKDTFEVFFGTIYLPEHFPKLGLIDYIFPFPFLFQKAWYASSNIVFTAILAIPYFALQVIKAIAAGALTLLVSPLVLIVHLCTKPKSNQYEESVMNLEASSALHQNSKLKTIAQILNETPELELKLFDDLGKAIETSVTPKLVAHRLCTPSQNSFRQKKEESYLCITRALGPRMTSGDHVFKVKINSENYKGLIAICKGNFFAVENLSTSINEVVSNLKPPKN